MELVMADTVTFRPTDDQGGFIEGLISSGDYSNQSEVIRAGLRLLQEHYAESKLAELRQLIKDGENSPIIENWNADDFIQRMKKKHNA